MRFRFYTKEFDYDKFAGNINALILIDFDTHKNIVWGRVRNHVTDELKFGARVKIIVSSVPSI